MPLLCLREAFKTNCLSKCINLFLFTFIHPEKELIEHEYSFSAASYSHNNKV